MKLFDLDGTLIDSNGVWREVDKRFLSARGLTSTDEYLDAVSHAIFPTAARFTIDYYHLDETPEQIMDEWMFLAKDAYENHIPLKPGTLDYLRQQAAAGETLALVTACVPELGYAVLNRHGLMPFFKHFVFAQELGLEKRDPRFFIQVLEHLNISPADCIFYEDSPKNCAIAKDMGMTAIGILDPLYANEEDEMYRICDRCIRDFTELL